MEQEQITPETKTVKAKKHVKKHKKKYTAATGITLLIAVLELWPQLCPVLPWKLKCEETKPLATFGVTKLQELQDAGTF